MTIVVSTPVSQRQDRVVNDICALQHDNTAAARARAQRWVAHVLQDANSRRKWWFLERAVATMLGQGEDVVELRGHIDKPVAVYAGRRLEKASLARITEVRQAAAALGRSNAGQPGFYAIERVNTGLRLHLWPAPGASSAMAVTANTGTDQLAVTALLSVGLRVRLSTTGTLPAPLAPATNYYVIAVSATAVKLATSLANAQAGTAIDITSAGTGTHTLRYGLTPFALLYTRPMDLAIVPDFWETIVLNGVLGTFGRHFDRDQLAAAPENFESRYEQQLRRGNTDTWDIERARRWEANRDLADLQDGALEASETQTALSEADGATTYTVPASLTGVGYVTIETGDYPLTAG